MRRCIDCKTLFPVNSASNECPYCKGKIVTIQEELSMVHNGSKKASQSRRNAGKRILVIDDVGFITDAISFILTNEGYLVETSPNADKGREMLKKEGYDLIILDIEMPGTPVSELVSELKEDKTMILYCSALPKKDADRKTVLKQRNVIGYLRKPFEIDTLISTVRSAL